MTPDKRVVYVSILDTMHPLCMTIHAQDMFVEQFGSYSGWVEALNSDADDMAAINATIDLLYIMMQGGRARVKALAWLSGEESVLPPEMSKEILRDVISLAELGDIQPALLRCFTAGSETTVEVENTKPKNAETTQL